MCILLKIDDAKFGASNLFFSKVTEEKSLEVWLDPLDTGRVKKTGKQVVLGLFVVISALCLPFYDLSQVPFVSTVKQFCENTNSFMVIQPKKTGKI